MRTYRAGGPAALVSKKRGKPSNRYYPTLVRTEALALIKANYLDFGPTLAAEKLAERHGFARIRQFPQQLAMIGEERLAIAADLRRRQAPRVAHSPHKLDRRRGVHLLISAEK